MSDHVLTADDVARLGDRHEGGHARLTPTTGDPSQAILRVERECPCGCTGDSITGCIRGLLTAALAVPLSTEAQLVLDVGALAHARWPNTLGELRVEVIDLGGVLGLLRAEVQLDVWERDGRLDTWKPLLRGQPAGTREGALVSLLEALAALDLADSVDPRDGMAF